jgi:hypothetical protein
VLIYDLVITQGDTFLPDSISYDLCYFEIIRNASLFTEVLSQIILISTHAN